MLANDEAVFNMPMKQLLQVKNLELQKMNRKIQFT